MLHCKQLRRQSTAAAADDESAIGEEDSEQLVAIAKEIEDIQRVIDSGKLDLPEHAAAELKALLSAGFPEWSRLDMKCLGDAVERHGTDYGEERIILDTARSTGKSIDAVRRYYSVFIKRYKELPEYLKIAERVDRGNRKALRERNIQFAVNDKIASIRSATEMVHAMGDDDLESEHAHRHKMTHRDDVPTQFLLDTIPSQISYNGTKGRAYLESEDVFLLFMIHQHGYGEWESIRREIRSAPQFRFNWAFKSRNALELQKRADFILRLLEKEYESRQKATEAAVALCEEHRMMTTTASASSSSSSSAAAAQRHHNHQLPPKPTPKKSKKRSIDESGIAHIVMAMDGDDQSALTTTPVKTKRARKA